MRVAACLLLQACLLLFRPDLLPVWGDEQFTLDVCLGPLGEITARVAGDNHPPGYYFAAAFWLRLLSGGEALVNVRVLSSLVMLASTVLLWQLFLRRFPDRFAAEGVLLLWVLSPFALMYGRMARSYSLQLFLFLLTVFAAEKAWRNGRWTLTALLTAATLYVHYVPGFCLLAVLVARLVSARRWRAALAYCAVVSVIYMPWICTALTTASRELAKDVYLVFQGHLAEHLLRLGYTWIAWHFGESLQLPLIAAGLPVTAAAAFLALRSGRDHRQQALSLFLAAGVGYVFVSRVVIFSLVPARLLFLVPFYWMLVAAVRPRFPRLSAAVAVALVGFDTVAITNYFSRSHFLNKGYLIPFEEIASRFREAGAGAVLVDVTSIDTRPVWPRIPPTMRSAMVAGPGSLDIVRPDDAVVFHVRGSRDLSRQRGNDWVDRELKKTRSCTVEGFTPYGRYDHWMMDLLGWPEKPSHMLQLVTCRL